MGKLMGRFSSVCFMVVDRDTGLASNVGFAPDSKAMLKLAYPRLPSEVFDREEVVRMMDECDNVTGAVYVAEPIDGLPLVANSTLEKLLKEIDFEKYSDGRFTAD